MESTTHTKEKLSTVKFATPDPNDFDWDTAGKAMDNYKSEDRARLEALYDQKLNQVLEREIVMGTVISLTSKEAVINIGYKSDGLVPLAEFRHMPDLKVGDEVEVYVETAEDKNGQLLLSHKKARAMKSWDRVNAALEKDEVVTGFVKCRTKGGLIVDVFGIEAFLPGSQIDVKPIRDYDIYVGKTMEFKVVKINQEFKNVVVSHKILIENELEKQKLEIMSKLEKGQVLQGTVKNITSYGVFMDLGGVDGLLHITDISWGRISHPEEVLKLDQQVNVVILDFDEEKKRIALGLKQLTPDPWGAILTKYPVGSKHKAKVRNFTNFGVFVELEEGVDGLIHISDLSWNKKVKHPAEFTKIGEELEVVVLEVDVENRRLSLGHKQLEDNPWETYESIFSINSVHPGVVGKVTDKGANITFTTYGVEAFAPYRQLQKEDGSVAKEHDSLDFKVIEFSKDNRRIVVSHTRLFNEKVQEGKKAESVEREAESNNTAKAVKKIKENQEKSTLGDISALAALKNSMEENSRKDGE